MITDIKFLGQEFKKRGMREVRTSYEGNILIKAKKLFGCFILAFSFLSFDSKAQDPQFTQFYAAPLYLNPAFTGSAGNSRAVANYRNQWPGLEANFVTYAASFDTFFPKYKSGFGLLLKRDEQGGGATAPLVSTDANLSYSYLIPINKQVAVQAGLQVGYGFRDLNFNSLIFGDQLDDRGPTGNPTAENFGNDKIGYLDVSTGALLFTNQMWLGFSAQHLNTPNMSFLGDKDPLPMKFSLHAGYKLPFGGFLRGNPVAKDQSITPTIMYISQGKSDQLSMGAYVNYDPLVVGFWYRGIPVKRFEDTGINQDAVAFLVGFKLDNFNIGYSYDYTVSKLNNLNSLGSHEISITYHFKQKTRGRSKGFGYPRVICPNPWKKYEKLNYQHVNH